MKFIDWAMGNLFGYYKFNKNDRAPLKIIMWWIMKRDEFCNIKKRILGKECV